jgi:hypothetical protein
MEAKTLDRREFTVASALALLSGVTITITGCGGSYGTQPSGSTGGDVTGSISNNHGHQAVVTGAQLAADDAIGLNIQGMADHAHIVQLSAGDLTQIAGGNSVTTTSSTGSVDGHQHTVRFSKGGSSPDGPGY